jgi:predicted Fe-Mo cluster-binding NifX family protein
MLKTQHKEKGNKMKYAIPTNMGNLSLHFGQSTEFTVIETDAENNILHKKTLSAQAHGCGATPMMLAREGVNIVLAGGMGYTPRQVFERAGVQVITGVTEPDPEKAVKDHLEGLLASGANVCGHGDEPCQGHGHAHGHHHG